MVLFPFLPLPAIDSRSLANLLLQICQTQVWLKGQDHIPPGPAVIVSNHRSFLDAPLLIAALGQPIHFACHYYMTQVPLLREITMGLGCIPLQQQSSSQITFFRQVEQCLQQRESIGIFPEGANRITRSSSPQDIGPFHPGFAQVVFRSKVDPLPIVLVAIQVQQEWTAPDIPLDVFRFFDPTEPMFQGQGGHPVVLYQQVQLTVAPPIWITELERQQSRRDRALHLQTLANQAQAVLHQLLKE
jgi:1-acyl-sn-glycerol-3-phosphate acyltransferase